MYCTRSDIEKKGVPADRIDELCDDEMTGRNNPKIAERVALAIEDAQTVIDLKLRATHTVPFADPVPKEIKMIAASIAAYNVSTRRGDEPSSAIQTHYDTAISLLKDMAKEVKDVVVEEEQKDMQVRTYNRPQIFTNDALDTMFPNYNA